MSKEPGPRRAVSMALGSAETDQLQKQLFLMENDTGMPIARGLKKGTPMPGGRPPSSTPLSPRNQQLPQGAPPPRGGPPGMVKGGMPPGMVKGGMPPGGRLPSGKAKGVTPKKRRAMPVDENGDVVFPSAVTQMTAAGSRSMYEPNVIAATSRSMYPGIDGKPENPPTKLVLKKEEKREGTEPADKFLSVSTYDLGAMTRKEGSGIGQKKLSLWTVRPSPSAGLNSGNNTNGISCPAIDSLMLKAGGRVGESGAPIEVKEHPMEWCKLGGGGGKEEDFLLAFMGQHGFKFKDDCAQLNQTLQQWRKMKGGGDKVAVGGSVGRLDAASLTFQGDKQTGEPFVRSGKVNALFLMLVDPFCRKECPFSSLEMTFFFTFPLFADYDIVLSMFCSLIQPYLEGDKGGKKRKEGDELLKAVVETLKHWASLVPEDMIDPPSVGRKSYGGGKELLQKVNNLLQLCGAPPIIPVSYTDRNYRFVNEFRKFQAPPVPLLPMNVRDTLSLLNIEPVEVARQLTIHSFSIFESIDPREWLTPGAQSGAGVSTGIQEMSEEFNRVSNFVAERILGSGEVEVRAEVMNKLVQVADELLGLKNFHSFMAVMCAFNSAPVLRLQKTWKAFRKGFKEGHARYSELCQIGEMDGNFGQLRKLSTRRSDSPMIPYLGLSLSDVTFILDGNKHSPVPLDHVNFEMLTMIGKAIIQIRTSQLIPYNFEVVPFVMEYLFDRPVADQNKLYNTSLKLEPRLTKEDTVKHSKTSMNSSFRRLSGFFAQGEIEAKFKLFDSKSTPDTNDSSSSNVSSEPANFLHTSPTAPMPDNLPIGLGAEAGISGSGAMGGSSGDELHASLSEPGPLVRGKAPTLPGGALPRGRAPTGPSGFNSSNAKQ